MNRFAEALTSLVWAMESSALQRFLTQVAAVTEAQIEHTIRAITEKPELLERMQTKMGGMPANTLRRDADVSESDLDIRNGVAHIAIKGPMMKQVPSVLNFLGIEATSTEAARAELYAALGSERVESIMLDIDSPGGTVEGTDALAGDVYAVRGLKPISARADDLMASAAMWVGAQAEHIEVGHSAAVGSIGVLAVVDDRSRQYENKGIKVHVVSSGELKGSFVEGSHVTEAQIDDLQRIIDTYSELFVDAVARGRGKSREDIAGLATGQMWIGTEAMDLGLVDAVEAGDGASIITTEPIPASPEARAAAMAAGPIAGVDYDPQFDSPAEAATAAVIANAARIRKGYTPIAGPNAAPAAQQEQTMTEEERKEMEKLRADNAALKIRTDAQDAATAQAKATLEAEQTAKREALLTEYADRFPEPAVRVSAAKMIEAMTPDLAESWLKSLPQVTRSDRESIADQAIEGALEQAKHGGPVTVEERSLGKSFGQSPSRVRDMTALGGASMSGEIESIENEPGEINGKPVMIPMAVMKDGRRLNFADLKKALNLKGVMTGIVFLIATLIAGGAQAMVPPTLVGSIAPAALSDARATQCRLSGFTKAYLMTASSTIYAGSLVMVDSAGTVVAAAAAASNQNIAGVAQETKTSGSSGSSWIRVSDGVICKFAGDTLQQDDVGVLVYAQDDQTVDETASTNEPVAGILVQYVSASVGWIYISSTVNFGRISVTADPMTLTGDLTLSGGAGAATFTDSASSIVVPDNDATALVIGSTGMLSLMLLDTTDANEELNIVGTTSTSSFRVDTGFATFDEQAVLTAGATAAASYTSTATAADAITLTGAAPTMTIKDNAAAALNINSSGTTNFILIDTTTGAEELNLSGDTGVSVFRVDSGLAVFDEEISIAGDAGAVTFLDTAAAILTIDADASALDIGSAGNTDALRYVSTDNAENFTVSATTGLIESFTAITGAVALDASDCGKKFSVSAGIDANTITLPDADAVLGCRLTFAYVGADGGALVDITPLDSDADGIEGGCTVAAAVDYFSGTADADIGLTKLTGLTGDTISLWACAAAMWCVDACTGIWANN